MGRTRVAFPALVLDDVRTSAPIAIGLVPAPSAQAPPPPINIAQFAATGTFDSVPTTETVPDP
jgi:hypothetical protein